MRRQRLLASLHGTSQTPDDHNTPPQPLPLVKRGSDPAARNDNQYTESGDRRVAPAAGNAPPNVSLVANVTTVRNNSKTALPGHPAMRLVTATMKLSAHTLNALPAVIGYRRMRRPVGRRRQP